jgi:hypothetical protein
MSKRLQVLLEEEEFEEIKRTARRHRMTVAAWVRRSLRDARRDEPARDRETKLASLARATRHDFPTGDIDQMLSEIEQGRMEIES